MIYLKGNVFHSTLLDQFSIIHGFGTRAFGDGRDIEIITPYFQAQHIAPRAIIKPLQSHSTNVLLVQSVNLIDKPVKIFDTDGVVTAKRKVLLTCITADCVPIIFYDPKAYIAGISHQGWKGTQEHMVTQMVDTMVQNGAHVDRIYCAFGPAINTCCYHMDLYTLNRTMLMNQGVKAQNIDIFPFCTCCDERFYSYRREGKITGEMIHFVMMS